MKPSASTIWLLAILIVLPVGAYLLGVRPIDQKRAALLQDMSGKQAALTTLNRSIATIRGSTAKAAVLRESIADFESKLPPDGQMDTVLEDIWRMAQANSLQTKTVKTPAVQRTHGYGEQTVELSLAGDFGGFYQFLLQLEGAKHVMQIKKLHISKTVDRDGEMQADVTMSVFFELAQGAL